MSAGTVCDQEEVGVLLIYLNRSLFIRGNVARKDLFANYSSWERDEASGKLFTRVLSVNLSVKRDNRDAEKEELQLDSMG